MKRVLLPGVATLLVVAGFVVVSGWNRSGEPRQRFTLTERELRLASATPSAPGDDPGLQLEFMFEHRSGLDARNWLTDERLRETGLALNMPASAPGVSERAHRALPRMAWVVFEFGGDTWREIDRRRELGENASRIKGWLQIAPTRLVPVDAGRDWEALLNRYPQHLILRASLVLNYSQPPNGEPLLFGSIKQLYPAAITVPRELRDRLAGLERLQPSPPGAPPPQPRYEVDLAVGRLGIPYITDIRRLASP